MLRRFYISLALCLFVVTLFLGVDRWVHRRSKLSFPDKIVSRRSFFAKPEASLPIPAEEKEKLQKIFNQKFTYYNKGPHAYVFVSEDKKYVLKFLKGRRLHMNSWLSSIPLSFNPYYQKNLMHQKNRERLFLTYKMAYLHLKKETGLLHLHLNQGPDLDTMVTVLDKKGERYEIALDDTCYYLQERGELLYYRLLDLMHRNDMAQAKKILSSVCHLIDTFNKKGVVNNNPFLRSNFALVNDTAIQISISALHIDPKATYTKNLFSLHELQQWIEENYPELCEHMQACLSCIKCSTSS